MYKTLTGIALLTIITGIANAAELRPFTNGLKTSADDVNFNFNELTSRINAVPAGVEGPPGPMGATGMFGPMGPTGPTGPQGSTGADGTGVITYSRAGYRSTNFQSKVFSVTRSDREPAYERFDFDRIDNGDGTGITLSTRYGGLAVDALTTDANGYSVNEYEWDIAGDIVFTQASYFGIDYTISPTPTAITLLYTTTYSPYRPLRTGSMGLGMSWGSTDTNTRNPSAQIDNPDASNVRLTTYRLLGVEDISVQSVNYTACLKIEHQFSNIGIMSQQIDWWCPNGEGLVKVIRNYVVHPTNANRSPNITVIREFIKTHDQTLPAL